jgi:hypothetical protein
VLSVGQHIVCLNDHFTGRHLTQALPTRGQIYTVRAIVPCKAQGYEQDGLHLVQVVNRPRRWRTPRGGYRTTELAFRVSRFRPVRSTDISVFRAMLEPTRVLESA